MCLLMALEGFVAVYAQLVRKAQPPWGNISLGIPAL
jgi:hypothetical protein